MSIEPYNSSHADAIAKLSLRAWSPVFDSLKEALVPAVWQQFYPDGWRVSQEKSVRDACANADFKTWVAIEVEQSRASSPFAFTKASSARST